MALGYQVFDERGQVVLDTTARTGRILGSVKLQGAVGRMDIPGIEGTPFVLVPQWPRSMGSGQFGNASMGGSVSFSGATLSWSFNTGFGTTFTGSTLVYYGAY